MRLIDADALNPKFVNGRFEEAYVSEKELMDAPTIDPVKHGKWELVDESEPRRYGCSHCKRLSWYMTNYCPNCGAKMDGGK